MSDQQAGEYVLEEKITFDDLGDDATTPEPYRDSSPPPGILRKTPSYEEAVAHGAQQLQEATDDDQKKSKSKKDKGPKKKPVPAWKLYRFSTWLDRLMILVGFFMAIAAGAALPGHMLLFGRVINQFVYYTVGLNISLNVAERVTAINSTNVTCDTIVDGALSGNIDFGMGMGMGMDQGLGFYCENQSTNILGNVAGFVCDPPGTLEAEITRYTYYYVGLASGVLVAAFLSTLLWNMSAYRQTRKMRIAFYRSILRQEIGWFDVNETATLNSRLQDDVEKIQAGIGDKVAVFLQNFSTFVSGFVIAFIFSWKLALVTATMLPVLSIMAATIAKIIASFTVREQKAYANAGAVAEEALSAIRTVVAFGGEQIEAAKYNVQLKKARNEGIKKGLLISAIIGMLFFTIFSTYALGFWYGSTLIANCELSPGDVVTVFFTVIIGSFSLGNALPDLETFASAMGAASVIFEIIDRKSLIDPFSEEGVVLDNLEGNIEFSDVVFHYPARPNVKVLKGIDLAVRKGKTVALVGSSGCGKSTVIQLIQRFYNPDGGLITIDGVDIKDLNLNWLRSNIGIVSQEPVLFDTTITENIRYGRDDATMEDIEEAAKNANAYDFIMQLPDKFETLVGEGGTQMSGGQKQRIAIARALVSNPKMLLLDEATSALDNESEKIVQDALDKARKGRTTIVIAHRLSTIQTADIIIGIADGRVIEMGGHSELMDKEGLYYELVMAQTIQEKEDEDDDPMAEFKRAVKRSYTRQQSTASEALDSERPGFIRQASTHSGYEVSGLTDSFSRFSLEDIPGAAHPSPSPGRQTFTSPQITNFDNSGEEERVTGEKTVRFQNGVVEVEEGEHKRRGSVRRLLSRKKKGNDEGLPDISFWELLKLNAEDWYLVLIGTVLSALIGCLFPLLAILFSEVIRVFGESDPDTIRRESTELAWGFVGLAAGACLIYFTSSFTLSLAGERLTKRLRLQSFKAILRQEISWFDKRANSTGALTTRLAVDASLVKGATGLRLGTLMQTFFGFIAALLIAFTASWELTIVLMFVFPVLGTVAYLQFRALRGKSEKNKKKLEGSGQTTVESIENIRTVAGLGVERKFFSGYVRKLRGPHRANMQSVIWQAIVYAVAQSLIFYIYAAGYRFGAYLVIEGRATYDDVFRVFAAVVFTALSIGRASSFAPDASKAQISAARVLQILRRKPAIDSYSDSGEKPHQSSGEISVDSVHFRYPSRPEVPVLQGLSTSVKPGQTLALVGPSGCGKSTLVSLVERFYDPVSGFICLDGNNLQDLNIKWLRSQVGLVSQEPVLFDASIADNIRYGANFRDVSDEEIIEAAKAANIHSFIESLPQGYSTNVGAKGTQMSGGQKQRIAIARALVRDPKVLLLDEATSALDTESEKVVQEALDKARQGRTSIVIAHRLSTIYGSDCIAVIHNGQVIESGTHSQLMELGGAYYHLNTVQLKDVDDL